jgi:hypothetical protein
MLGIASGAITGSRQRRRSNLQDGIVCYVQLPIRNQAVDLTLGRVTINDPQQVADLLGLV